MEFTIVAGVSSSGKSTYIGAMADGSGLLASEVSCASEIPDHAWLHYNTLRYANNDPDQADRSYFSDQLLCSLLSSERKFNVVFVFCEMDELLRRIRSRTTIEGGVGTYPSAQIERCVQALDYGEFHRHWLSIFERSANAVRLVHASNGRFASVSLSTFDRVVQIDSELTTPPPRP